MSYLMLQLIVPIIAIIPYIPNSAKGSGRAQTVLYPRYSILGMYNSKIIKYSFTGLIMVPIDACLADPNGFIN